MNQNLPCLRQCEKVMAYSCVEVWFEIGHEASERAKRTAEGFTHDWEVFVRGVDNADIHYFVEKVVFHLHETFSKPKRVVKEPPYSVKESGYAGFILPIEVYFKNKDEPKKVKYSYDLQLRYNGSPFTNVKKEKYTFSNPSEDFRRKLIRGGGVGVLGSEAGGNSVSSEKTCAEEGTPSVQPTVKHSTPTLAGKPKLTSDPPKKAKIKEAKVEELKSSNSFADLFGTPIKTKVSPDPKKSSQSKVSPVSKNSKSVEKTEKPNSDKQHNASKPKHIPQKEIKKDASGREEKGERKDKNKDRERVKEKNSNKHSTSPPKLSKEENKKSSGGEHKERVEPKSSETKSERKKDKRAKDERIKKEKHKDVEKLPSEKPDKSEKHTKESKEREPKKSPKHSSKEVEKSRDKEKHVDSEKDKMRHKHKKKDKYKKVKEESKEREKSKKAEEKEVSAREHHVEKHKRSDSHSLSPSPQPSPILTRSPEKEPEMPAPVVKDKPSKNPLSALCEELEYHTSDSSSSHLSGDDDVIEPPKLKAKIFSSPREPKPEPVKEISRVIKEPENFHVDRVPTPEPIVEDVKPSKHKTSSHKDKGSSGGSASKSKSKDKSIKKKDKEVMDSSSAEVKDVERKKKKRNKRSREEEVTPEELPAKKAKDDDIVEEPPKEKVEKVNDSALKPPADNPSIAKSKFSKEYVSELLDLQKKIMTIKDDSELQRVVQVLAQSGKYEINNKSFDVDLCALDKSTVKKLQEFFTVS